ncbi:MAG: rhodanese-like domain-containing protein [Bacteroidales bacterium]|jgi:rhodanese-related sulfurtransferase|nr:rhodanese-like domain-containing protein [Bacteroidales bacterium]MBP5704146.1 rhodanese-like domain-containing protein [Paludibacteraceae bacterium]
MKRLGNYFVMLTVAILAMFGTSCSGDDSEDLGPFVEYAEAKTFYETYKSYNDGPKVLIDYRSASDYAAGHLTGAQSRPATVYNTADDNAQWCKDLLAEYPTNTCLFFYGSKSFEMNKTVAGRASRLGYGKVNSRIYTKGYDEEVQGYFGVEK